MKLHEIAERLGYGVEGDGNVEINGVAGLDEAQPSQITFLSNPRYTPKLKTTQASALVAGEKAVLDTALPVLRAPDAYVAFARIAALFYEPPAPERGVHPSAVVSPSARLGTDVSVGPQVVIGDDVVIGDRVTIHPNCTIYPGARIGDDAYLHSNCVVREHVRIGARCRLQNNVTVGSDGFGYAKLPDRSWLKIVQAGTVVVEDDVEIGAGAQIDRASVGETRIGRGTKIDNLVQIGHGSKVGEDALLCAQVGLAGSTHVGNRVVLAGQVGVAGHLEIGDDAVATAQTGIPNSVPAGKVVSGYPAIDNRAWLKSSAVFEKLPDLHKLVRQLQARIEILEAEKKVMSDEG